MVQRIASFRNRRYNSYVPACGYAADIIHGSAYEVDFLTPIAAVAAGVLSALSIATAGTSTTFVTDIADAPFGRNVTVVASGAATSTVTVTGKDYLGQGMTELLTLNGATPVLGNKAFKWIDSIAYGATAATTINVGFGSKLGLPYRMSNALAESVNGAPVAIGTFVAGILTDPQTNATGDPRGTYITTGTMNGSNRILATFMPYNVLNANGNGGLYGIQAA